MIRVSFLRLAALVLLAVISGACGSGSSGFDPQLSAAAQSEQQAIRDASDHGTCSLEPSNFVLCGGNAPSPGIPALGVPNSTDGQPISNGIHCTSATGGCAFSLAISPQGYDPGTDFLGAVRPADFRSPWRSSTGAFTSIEGPTESYTGEFVTDFPVGTSVFVAILSYPPRTPLPDVGPTGVDVDVLTDLIAARADVIVDVPLLPPGG